MKILVSIMENKLPALNFVGCFIENVQVSIVRLKSCNRLTDLMPLCKLISSSYKGQFTLYCKWKWIRNVNLEWFKTVRAFTLAQKRNRKNEIYVYASRFCRQYKYSENSVV